MADRHRSLEFQDRHGHLWQIEMTPNAPVPCFHRNDCGKATRVDAVCYGREVGTIFGEPIPLARQMYIDEAADPQETVNAVLDWINEEP